MTDWLRHVVEDAERFGDAVRAAPDAPVAACPEWTVRDLAVHLGAVHRRFTEVLRRGLTERPEIALEVPGDADLPAWVRDGALDIVEAVEAAEPDRRVWNWTGTPEPPAWVARRIAHETAVHRFDAQAAAGAPEPIDGDLAVDGVDEFLDVILVHRTTPWEGPVARVHLHRTDGPGEWLLSIDPDGIAVTRGHERGDVALRGTASTLVLALWRRLPVSALEVLGDDVLAERVLAWPRL